MLSRTTEKRGSAAAAAAEVDTTTRRSAGMMMKEEERMQVASRRRGRPLLLMMILAFAITVHARITLVHAQEDQQFTDEDFNLLVEDLNASGFSTGATFLKYARFLLAPKITLLIPTDTAIVDYYLTDRPPANLLLALLKYHLLERNLVYSQFRVLPVGTWLPTALPDFGVQVTSNTPSNVSLNNAQISKPDLCPRVQSLITCQGISTVLNSSLYGPQPTNPALFAPAPSPILPNLGPSSPSPSPSISPLQAPSPSSPAPSPSSPAPSPSIVPLQPSPAPSPSLESPAPSPLQSPAPSPSILPISPPSPSSIPASGPSQDVSPSVVPVLPPVIGNESSPSGLPQRQEGPAPTPSGAPPRAISRIRVTSCGTIVAAVVANSGFLLLL